MTAQPQEFTTITVYEEFVRHLKAFDVDDSYFSVHTRTFRTIVDASQGSPPMAVQKHEKNKIAILFMSLDRERSVTVYLRPMISGEVGVQRDKGKIERGSTANIEAALKWMIEGQPNTNFAKRTVAEKERLFHPPFKCGWYSNAAKGKQLPLKKILSGDSLKDVYDRYRKLAGDEAECYLVVNALLRTGQHPNEIGELIIPTKMLEIAFYHGG